MNEMSNGVRHPAEPPGFSGDCVIEFPKAACRNAGSHRTIHPKMADAAASSRLLMRTVNARRSDLNERRRAGTRTSFDEPLTSLQMRSAGSAATKTSGRDDASSMAIACSANRSTGARTASDCFGMAKIRSMSRTGMTRRASESVSKVQRRGFWLPMPGNGAPTPARPGCLLAPPRERSGRTRSASPSRSGRASRGSERLRGQAHAITAPTSSGSCRRMRPGFRNYPSARR